MSVPVTTQYGEVLARNPKSRLFLSGRSNRVHATKFCGVTSRSHLYNSPVPVEQEAETFSLIHKGTLVPCKRCGAGLQEEADVRAKATALIEQALTEGVSQESTDWYDAHIIEAVCPRCGETFNPNPFEDEGPWLEHLQTMDEQECGGIGVVIGAMFL